MSVNTCGLQSQSSNDDPALQTLITQLEESGLQMDLSDLQAESTPTSSVFASLNEINSSCIQYENGYSPDNSIYLMGNNYYDNHNSEFSRQSPTDNQYSPESYDNAGFYSNEMCNPEFPNQYHQEYHNGNSFTDMSNLSSTPHYGSLQSDRSESVSDTDSLELEEHELSTLHSQEFDIRTQGYQQPAYLSNEYCQRSPYPSLENRDTLPNFKELSKSIKMSRRGRPCTYRKRGSPLGSGDEADSEDDYHACTTSPGKGRRGAKNVLLWKFLLEELRQSRDNQSHIKWMDKNEGTFRFIDTAEISRLWGEKKKKTDMNFEKLSRGIRHYYRDGLMSRQEGTRLVYKFNWERVPKAYRM